MKNNLRNNKFNRSKFFLSAVQLILSNNIAAALYYFIKKVLMEARENQKIRESYNSSLAQSKSIIIHLEIIIFHTKALQYFLFFSILGVKLSLIPSSYPLALMSDSISNITSSILNCFGSALSSATEVAVNQVSNPSQAFDFPPSPPRSLDNSSLRFVPYNSRFPSTDTHTHPFDLRLLPSSTSFYSEGEASTQASLGSNSTRTSSFLTSESS